MHWLALDIGGANLKVAHTDGYAACFPLQLWNSPDVLTRDLRAVLAEAPASDHLAVTMTGELADCFETKTEGVKFILDAVHQAADGRHTRVYLSDGQLVAPQLARESPLLAAAANWHALARFCGRFAPSGPALLIDVGSTTSDLIPLLDGCPAATARDDTRRLAAGELVYTGVERSPVCALVSEVPYRGSPMPVAQEVFATTRDVYLILGDLPEDPNDTQTADGRGASVHAATVRLARMLCATPDQVHSRDAQLIARAVAHAQLKRIRSAAERVLQQCPAPPETVVLSGHGEFLARSLLDELDLRAKIVSLAQQCNQRVSRCGPAYALAMLAKASHERS